MTKRKIVLQFISGADEDNNYRYKRKTLRNIRPDVGDDQLRGFISRYCALTAYPLAEAVIVDERVLVMEEEEELVLISSEEEQEASVVKEGEDLSEKGVTNASFQESEAILETPKEATTTLKEPEKGQAHGLAKEPATTSERIVPKVALDSLTEKNNLWLKAMPASLTQSQEPLTSKIRDMLLPVVKDKQRVDIKMQSPPPLEVDHERVEPEIKSSLLDKKTAIVEEEIIDASQACSVEALLDLALKSETESLNEKPLPLIKDQPLPTLQFLTQEIDRDLPSANQLLPQSFIMPVKKKRMHPPMGKKTKPSKKKR